MRKWSAHDLICSSQSGHRKKTINSAEYPASKTSRSEQIGQTVKWVVYSLLIVNWGYYIFVDWQVAQHTLVAGDSLREYFNSYATSLDELAWFMMLFLFEAETYWLDTEAMTRLRRRIFVALRVICYAFLAHTVYAYIFSYYELTQAPILTAIGSTCDLAVQNFSFVRNLAYTLIDANNCGALSSANALYQIGGDEVVTDLAGLNELKFLYAVDIEDALIWLGVVLTIELVVLMQERGISGGALISGCNYLVIVLYALLVGNAALWIWKGHWVYGWDQLLWIGGFAAIGSNLSQWRDELKEEAVPA